jgi:hypothetical protein
LVRYLALLLLLHVLAPKHLVRVLPVRKKVPRRRGLGSLLSLLASCTGLVATLATWWVVGCRVCVGEEDAVRSARAVGAQVEVVRDVVCKSRNIGGIVQVQACIP